MRALHFEEIQYVAGGEGEDIPVVEIRGERMTDAEKYEYDMQNSSGFWDSFWTTVDFYMRSTDWKY